ncbi:MAG: tRNA (adenosine(37)-N6)-dimethylallyltransferase MiaA [Jannaschia sp.]
MLEYIRTIPNDRPVLIAGPTASGKSGLALAIARSGGGRIVNADAMQVFGDWRVLTARPSASEMAQAPHALYGHVDWGNSYSVGDWLRGVAALPPGPRPIFVGGTGLYFRALTEGLADIPATPPEIREEAEDRLRRIGLSAMASELDPDVRADLDTANPARVLRAWEVARATGRSIRKWQAETPPGPFPRAACTCLLLDAPKDWLNPRIERRFDAMLAAGALEEARAVLPRWDPALNAARAIGAPDLIAHLRGEIPLEDARDRAVIATRRYAKRQRTWFRAHMTDWARIDATTL